MQLVLEVLRKDRKATAEFVNRYADQLYGYIRRRLIPHTEAVDDLVQEVFLAAWENLESFKGESPLRNWLLGIARHRVEDHYRKRLREVQVLGEEESPSPEPVDASSVEEAIQQQEAAKMTKEILARLPESYSIVLLWRYWEMRSLSEIAAQTGRTEKAIERLLARARLLPGFFRWNATCLGSGCQGYGPLFHPDGPFIQFGSCAPPCIEDVPGLPHTPATDRAH